MEKEAKKEKKQQESELEVLKRKLQECEKLRDEYLRGWQRARADFLNYKNEEIKRFEELRKTAQAEFLLKVLKIFDNLERAKNQVPTDLKNSDWVKGILQIESQFRNFLNEHGVEEIKAIGEKFDPNFHEAIQEVEGEEGKSGLVVEVVEKGYLFEGQVLRPAKVKVAK